MFKLPVRAICSGVRHTQQLPLLQLKHSISAQPVSTKSASSYMRAVTKALEEFQMSPLRHAASQAAWPTSARQKLGLEQPRGAEQLVLRAKRSLAASSVQNGVSTERSEKDAPSLKKRDGATAPTLDCTKSWDGPTVWAHLW
jgi:hypothetical protein